MPDRIYNGPVPEVDVNLDSGMVAVKRGEVVEVSDAEAVSLDAQGDWLDPAKADNAVSVLEVNPAAAVAGKE